MTEIVFSWALESGETYKLAGSKDESDHFSVDSVVSSGVVDFESDSFAFCINLNFPTVLDILRFFCDTNFRFRFQGICALILTSTYSDRCEYSIAQFSSLAC